MQRAKQQVGHHVGVGIGPLGRDEAADVVVPEPVDRMLVSLFGDVWPSSPASSRPMICGRSRPACRSPKRSRPTGCWKSGRSPAGSSWCHSHTLYSCNTQRRLSALCEFHAKEHR